MSREIHIKDEKKTLEKQGFSIFFKINFKKS